MIACGLRAASLGALSSPGSDRSQHAETVVVEYRMRGLRREWQAGAVTTARPFLNWSRGTRITARDGYRSPKIPG